MMEQQKRLIELLTNAPADEGGRRDVHTLAEYLLKNGVYVQSGDTEMEKMIKGEE